MHTNQEEEEEDECAVCNESLPKLKLPTTFARMTCCGKGTHKICYDNIYKSSMSNEQKNRCIMCRTKHAVAGSKEKINQIRRWVEKGKAWAQCALGQKYDLGEGVEQSCQRAAALFELAASQGNATAQFNLGNMCREGRGVDQSYERAVEYYEAAAKQGHAVAQCNLGLFYVSGLGAEQSNENAREWWMKAAEQGNEDAIGNLQILDKQEGRTTPSFTPPKRCSTCNTPKTSTHKLRNCKCKGAQYCNAKCQAAHWKSHQKEHRRLCKEMELTNTEGQMKEEGGEEEEEEGETKEASSPLPDQEEEEEEDVCPVCIEALQKNERKFIRFTCCGKGIHMWCAKGLEASSSLSDEQKTTCPLCRAKQPMSEEEMVKNLRPWVEKGKAWAQSMLGTQYEYGNGVNQSYQQARELYELSASQGNANAQYNLGIMYEQGQGVDQSYERAKEYYEAAAKQGYDIAQSNLGGLYYNGQCVDYSNEMAREWWMKSAEQGNESAIQGLQMLDKKEGRTTPSFIPKPIECGSCYRPHDPTENKLRPCARCHRVYYCGKECQLIHWKNKINGHKKRCKNKPK